MKFLEGFQYRPLKTNIDQVHLTCNTRIAEMPNCKRIISQEKHYSYLRAGSTGIICVTKQRALDLQLDPIFTLLSIDD